MAKTAYAIQMDYDRAMRQADKLDECARKIKNQRKQLQTCRHRVAGAWQGENGTLYVKKLATLEGSLAESEKKLRQIATTVRDVARRTYQAEQRALAIAKKRVY